MVRESTVASRSVSRIIEVLDPVGIARPEERPLATRLNELKGKVIGLLDNTKPNFDVFLDEAKTLFQEQCEPKQILSWRKANPAISAGSILEEMAERCQAVVTGSGD